MVTQQPSRNTFSKQDEEYWVKCIKEWYPHLDQKTYFFPPLHINRVAYNKQIRSGIETLVPTGLRSQETPPEHGHSGHAKTTLLVSKPGAPPPQESDWRDDKAQERLLHSLRELAERKDHKEVMMVISQLDFGKFLNKASYAPAQDAFLPHYQDLPHYKDLPHYQDLPVEYCQGDFDVLIIHSLYGLMIGEVKSVGVNFDTLAENKTDSISRKVKQAIVQLNKANFVLKHLVSDINDMFVTVTKFLALPYITCKQLAQVVHDFPEMVQKELCQCLGGKDIAEALGFCLCADMMPNTGTPWSDMPAEVRDQLSGWWSRCLAAAQPRMTPAVYEKLIARFCGPATTVEIYCVTSPRLEIRTEWEGIAETGERMARFVLLPEQVDILNISPPRIFLNGPPGTGKTVVLILQGLSWLAKHHVVHVVSTYHESIAAAIIIQHQMRKTQNLPDDDKRVRLHTFDFEKNPEDVTTTAAKLLSEIFHTEQVAQAANSKQEMGNERTLHTTGSGSAARGSQPGIESSENARSQLCVLVDEAGPYDSDSPVQPFSRFCDKLIETVGIEVVHMWAAAVLSKVRPECLEEVVLTVPLRTPPVVTREISTSWQMQERYVPSYSDSKYPIEVRGPPVKRIQHTPGQLEHAGEYPYDCPQCGIEVAEFLLTDLHIVKGSTRKPNTLHFSDVIVLCYGPREEQKDDYGQVLFPATGLVRGLRSRGVPVYVLEYGADIEAITDVTLAVHDNVTVTYWNNICGLEKKVVIVTGHDLYGLDVSAKLNCISRCSSQLVWIQWDPSGSFQDPTDT